MSHLLRVFVFASTFPWLTFLLCCGSAEEVNERMSPKKLNCAKQREGEREREEERTRERDTHTHTRFSQASCFAGGLLLQ